MYNRPGSVNTSKSDTMFPCSSIRRSDISLSAWVLAPNIQIDWSFHSCWSCLPPHNPKVARNQIYTAKLTEDNKFAQPSSYENLTFFMATVFPVSRHLSNQIQHLLIPTCGFVGFLPFFVICFFSSQKKYSSKTKSTAKKRISFSEKKTITKPKKPQLIGLHRKTTPQDPSPILSNFWYFSRGFASSSEKTIQVEKTSWKNFEIWGSYHWRTSAKSTHWFWTQTL